MLEKTGDMSTSCGRGNNIAMETIVHPSNPPLVSLPSGREAHQSSEGTALQIYYEVDLHGTQSKLWQTGDVSIRSFFKKGRIPQLQGVWLADSPQLFITSESSSDFHPMLFSGWSPVSH